MTILYIVTAKILRLEDEDGNYVLVGCCLFVDFILIIVGAVWVQDTLALLQ